MEEDQVVRPNGSEGIYGKVHFKNKALGIIPLDEELNTWLVGQFRYTLNEYSWEIPMGGVPLDEDTLEGAKRELQEETGLIAKKWTNLMKIHTSNSVTDELILKKLPIAEAVNMVMTGEITDSLSVAGLLMLARKLGI